jgi:hypothetical protein
LGAAHPYAAQSLKTTQSRHGLHPYSQNSCDTLMEIFKVHYNG